MSPEQASGVPHYLGFAEVEAEYLRAFLPEFNWVVHAQPSRPNPPSRSLDQARVALLSTSGAYVPPQPPFDAYPQNIFGDATYREIAGQPSQLRFRHGAINTKLVYRDPEVVFPIRTLNELAADGVIGPVAPVAYSFMGYIPYPDALVHESGPQVAARLVASEVDIVLLVPV